MWRAGCLTGDVISSGSIMPSPAPLLTLATGLSREFLLHHGLCPKRHGDDDILVVAVAPDALEEALADLERVYGLAVRTEPATIDEVERLVERLTNRSARGTPANDLDGDRDETTTDVRSLAAQPPVVRYVNLLLRDAHEAGASDVHLEASRSGLAARFRVDGVLVPAPEPPTTLEQAVVSRVKLLADMDIAERRKPQDGRLRVRLEDRELDLRVSSVPTVFGESVVLRLLDRGGRPVTLDELGLGASDLGILEALARRTHGMILVTGPTGSGKTTTLYACLILRDRAAEKIITVEDPVEYHLDGIAQVPVQRQAGVTFAGALRSILRQDPDVMMIGEMRDRETAEIAVQSAMTGHLVFSTLHTNDALGAIPRLIDLGVPEYLVAATVEGVLAQRLVRRVCDGCRADYVPNQEAVLRVAGGSVDSVRFQRGAGCALCRGTGYRGRIGIFELLQVSGEIKEAITARASRRDLAALAGQLGMRSMREDGWEKVQAGLTTVEEVLRVAQE